MPSALRCAKHSMPAIESDSRITAMMAGTLCKSLEASSSLRRDVNHLGVAVSRVGVYRTSSSGTRTNPDSAGESRAMSLPSRSLITNPQQLSQHLKS